MKKIISLLLITLIILSFSSCSEKPVPTARELMIGAKEITSGYRTETVIGAVAVINGEPVTFTALLDTDIDSNDNIHIKYTLALPTYGLNTSGNIYSFKEDDEFYMQSMGVWLGFKHDDLYQLYDDPDEYEEMRNDALQKAEALTNKFYEDGLDYSEVTRKENDYVFTMTGTEKTGEYIVELIDTFLFDVDELRMAAEFFVEDYPWITDTIGNTLSAEYTFNPKTLHPKEFYMDLTPVANEIISKIAEDPADEYVSDYLDEFTVSVSNLSVDVKYPDYGNISPITLDENIKTMAKNYYKSIYAIGDEDIN